MSPDDLIALHVAAAALVLLTLEVGFRLFRKQGTRR